MEKRAVQRALRCPVCGERTGACEDTIAWANKKERFVQQAAAVVETNLSNADYSVVDLSRALKISRVTLYKKLLALAGKTPLLFIRHLRLQRAAQLLEQSWLPVSKIAYATGFYNPKYFARQFKEQYNMTPSAYQKARRKGQLMITGQHFTP